MAIDFKILTRFIYIGVILLLMCGEVFAQRPVEVIANVMAPFPQNIGDIEENGNTYSITVINHTDVNFEVYFLIDLVGNNGVSANIDPMYRPMEPYSLDGRAMVTLSSQEISDLNMDLTSDMINYEGVDATALVTGSLPEGQYQICVTAYAFETGEPLSAGCSMSFPIGGGNTSRIITPFEGEIIPEQEIPSFNISWEPPLGDPSQNMDLNYIVKMVDITANYDWDIEELFSGTGIPPVIEETVEGMPFYLYNGAGDDPELIEGHEYGIRIRIDDGSMEQSFDNGGYSEIRRFWYANNDGTTVGDPPPTDQTEELASDCEGRCDPVLVSNNTPVTDLASIGSIKIGNFYLYEPDLTANGNTFSGTAEVRLDFLNDLKLIAQVQNIKVNANGDVFEGKVRIANASVSELTDFTDYLGFNAGGLADAGDNYIPENINGPLTQVLQNTRNIIALAGGPPTGLPFGFDQDLKGNKMTLGITAMELTPTGAKAKLVVGAKLALFEGENMFMMVADSVCIHPAGFGGSYQVGLGQNLVLPNAAPNGFELAFLGESGNSDQYCNISMTCDGVESFTLAGEVKFPRNMFTPLAVNDQPIPDTEKVKATFTFQLDANQNEENPPTDDEGGGTETLESPSTPEGESSEESSPVAADETNSENLNWLATLDFDPFSIRGLDGWEFTVEEAAIDMSDFVNPAGATFPENYHTTTNDFRGFYIKRAMVKPPEDLIAEDTYAEVTDLLIDDALYCNILAKSILPVENGRIGGWGFGIDTLQLDIYDNALITGKLTGPIQMPLAGDLDTLKYRATISDPSDPGSSTNSPYEYAFNVDVESELTFPFLIADATITDDSYLEIGFVGGGDNADPYINAHLNGSLSIDTDQHYPQGLPSLPAELKMPNMQFQIVYGTEEGFDSEETYLAFASPQKKIGGFMVGMDNFDCQLNATGETVSVRFEVGVSLAKGELDLNAGATFSLVSNIESMDAISGIASEGLSGAASTISKIRLSSVEFDSITVGIERGPFALAGSIIWYDEEVNGQSNKGIKGQVDVNLPIGGVQGQMLAIFGTVGEAPDVPEGTPISYSESYFNYWYVSGMLGLGSGIPLGGGIALLGIGGGVGYNIIQTESQQVVNGEIVGDAVFTPTYESFRIEFVGMIATQSNTDAFNADIKFIAQFQDGGLDMLGIEGWGYLMTPIEDREEPKVLMQVAIYLYTQSEVRDWYIDGSLLLAVNIDDQLYGNMNPSVVPNQMVRATFYVSASTWHFYAGQPDFNYDDNVEPRGSAVFNLPSTTIDLKAYMMVGHGIPTSLPPLPPRLEEMLNGPSGDLDNTESAADVDNDLASANHGEGQGFAHGVSGELETTINASIIYAYFNVILGYDINITKRDQYCSNTGGQLIGANGWYAEGQAYAGLEGSLGLNIRFMGRNHQIELFHLIAAIALQIGAPAPTYFSGRASIYFSVLGGLVSGSEQFSFNLGERCAVIPTDPLAGINFIEAVDPSNGDNPVPTYARARVDFTMPIDEVIEIPNPVYNGNNEVVRTDVLEYIPRITMQLQENWGNKAIVPTGGFNWMNDNQRYVAIMRPNSLMQANRWYRLTVTVQADDLQTGNKLEVNGKIWQQDTVVVFRTGDIPEDLYDLVRYSTPMANERYFLQREEPRGKIYFTMALPKEDMFPSTTTIGGGRITYKIKITNLQTQETIETPFNNFCDGFNPSLDFDIPDLDNEQIYALQVLKVNPYHRIAGGITKSGNGLILADTDNLNVQINKDYTPPGETFASNEELLYHSYFRTSKYDNFQEKAQTIDITSRQYVTGSTAYGKKMKVKFTLGEKFERRDFNFFRPQIPYNEDLRYRPRIMISDLFNSDYHDDHAQPLMTNFINEFNNTTIYGVNLSIPLDQMEIAWNGNYSKYQLLYADIDAATRPPLSASEIQSLWESYLRNGTFVQWGNYNNYYNLNTGALVNSTESEFTFTTNYLVMKDKNAVLTLFNHWYTLFGYWMNSNQTLMSSRTALLQRNLRLQNNTGTYKLFFNRNLSSRPEQITQNIMGRFVNFDTPIQSFQPIYNPPIQSGGNGNGSSIISVLQTPPMSVSSSGGLGLGISNYGSTNSISGISIFN